MRILLFLPLLICLSLLYFFFRNNTHEVTEKPYAQEIVGKCLELTQDVFLWKWSEDKEYDIDLPGELSGSYLPVTIQDYLDHPNDWENTESYRRKMNGNMGSYRAKVIGVLRKGTRLKVIKVTFIRTAALTMHKCTVEILDGPFKGTTSKISLIYDYSVPSSQKLKIDERALKFCDEEKQASEAY